MSEVKETPEIIETTPEELEKTISEETQKAKEEASNEYTKEVSELRKSLNDLKQKQGSFTNVQVKDEKVYPLGAIAVAKIKAKREHTGKDYLEYLKEADNTHSRAAVKYLDTTERVNKSAYDYNQFQDRAKAIGLGSVVEGARVNAPGVEPGFITELLPNLAVARMQGIQRRPLNMGMYEMSVEQDGTTMYWGNEGASLTSSDINFDSRRLQAKKGYVFTPISNDKLRFDSNILGDVEASMLRQAEKGFDTGYISGSGNSNQPLGIYNAAATSNAATATPTATKIKKDLRTAVVGLQDNNVDFTNPYWIITPAMRTSLVTQYDSDAKLAHYARQIEEQNSLFGIPIITSNNASSDKVALVDASEIVVADGQGFDVDADSSYGFNSDTTYLRLVGYTDINYVHKNSSNQAYGVGLITATNTSGSDWITA